jgi:hypothetical protein
VKDSRLTRVTALLDDARSLLIEIVDEGPTGEATVRDFNCIDSSRQFINSAIVYAQMADSEYTAPDQPA